jgi:cellulose biosynthesis protein BcsQ
MPTDCGSFSSWEGLPDTIAHTQRIRDDAASVGVHVGELIGIVPNMYRTKTSLAQHMVTSLRETYGDLVWEPIPLRQAIQDAQVMREFLFSTNQVPETTDILWTFVDNVINKVVVHDGS